jgi:hypothetical protein
MPCTAMALPSRPCVCHLTLSIPQWRAPGHAHASAARAYTAPAASLHAAPDAGLGGGAARIAVRPPGLRLAPTAEADETGGSAGGASRGSATPSRSASPPDAPSGGAPERAPSHPGDGACGSGGRACAAAAGLEAGAEAGRKRKADAAAVLRSPAAVASAAPGAAGCKRRQSPEAQVRPGARPCAAQRALLTCHRLRACMRAAHRVRPG